MITCSASGEPLLGFIAYVKGSRSHCLVARGAVVQWLGTANGSISQRHNWLLDRDSVQSGVQAFTLQLQGSTKSSGGVARHLM
jgi:hypothetical protein